MRLDGPPQPEAAPHPAAVLAALGLPAPEAAERATGGADTLVWRVRVGGAALALRLLQPGQDGRCRREAAAMAAATAAGVPVPAVRAQGQWEGRPVLLMDWCPGETVTAAVTARPASARRMGRLFGAIQAAIHAVPAPHALNARWLTAGGPAAQPLRARLEALPARTDRLIHFDYHPLNVLTDGERITGVIDWANAGAGDPRADVARTMSILRLEYRRPGARGGAVGRFDLGWREGYASASGLPVDAAHALFYAWAGLAMVADLQGRRDEAFFRRVRFWSACWAARLPG